MSTELSEQQLADLQTITLDDYGNRADVFWAGTRNHDVLQNYTALLSQFESDRILDILDFGCGPGRDLRYFKRLGHRPVGLDGSPEFCAMARAYTGCEILHQRFLALDLPLNQFDGIFANASLFHVPSQCLTEVLTRLCLSLRPEGILFSSNPRGRGEGWRGERYGNFMELNAATASLKSAGFEIISHYYRPEGLPLDQQPWLAIVSRKL